MTPMLLVYVVLGLFTIDALMVLLHHNVVIVLIGVEIMLDSYNLALMVLSQINHNLDGQVVTSFVMVVAAVEIMASLTLIVSLFHSRRTTPMDDLKPLNE